MAAARGRRRRRRTSALVDWARVLTGQPIYMDAVKKINDQDSF
jgi:hypothetical protein